MESRTRFCRALRGREVDRPPVWLMRQAGRYLPEYRAIREKHGFWEMMKNPGLAAEITLQPIRRFGMDAAILFSDILIVLDALGISVRYQEGGPQLSPLVRRPEDLQLLSERAADSAFDHVAETLTRLAGELHPRTALIGFTGAPFTLASYAIQGGPAKHVNDVKELAARDFALFDALSLRICDTIITLLRRQAAAGVDALQLFDTWSAHLTPVEYQRLALPYTKRVIAGLADLELPVIAYVRNAAQLAELAATSGCQVVAIDASLTLGEAHARLPRHVALQGNFDTALLSGARETITAAVNKAIRDVQGRGYIVNLGQGLTPDSPIAGVEAFVDAVRTWKAS